MTTNLLKIQTTIERNGKFYVVSTVQLDPQFGSLAWNGPYETLVFASDAEGKVTDYMDLAAKGYKDEFNARVGHEYMCSVFYLSEEKLGSDDSLLGAYVSSLFGEDDDF